LTATNFVATFCARLKRVKESEEPGTERNGLERRYLRCQPWCHFRRKGAGERYNPDYVALVRACGTDGVRITSMRWRPR
jgi:hypothetical protein